MPAARCGRCTSHRHSQSAQASTGGKGPGTRAPPPVGAPRQSSKLHAAAGRCRSTPANPSRLRCRSEPVEARRRLVHKHAFRFRPLRVGGQHVAPCGRPQSSSSRLPLGDGMKPWLERVSIWRTVCGGHTTAGATTTPLLPPPGPRLNHCAQRSPPRPWTHVVTVNGAPRTKHGAAFRMAPAKSVSAHAPPVAHRHHGARARPGRRLVRAAVGARGPAALLDEGIILPGGQRSAESGGFQECGDAPRGHGAQCCAPTSAMVLGSAWCPSSRPMRPRAADRPRQAAARARRAGGGHSVRDGVGHLQVGSSSTGSPRDADYGCDWQFGFDSPGCCVGLYAAQETRAPRAGVAGHGRRHRHVLPVLQGGTAASRRRPSTRAPRRDGGARGRLDEALETGTEPVRRRAPRQRRRQAQPRREASSPLHIALEARAAISDQAEPAGGGVPRGDHAHRRGINVLRKVDLPERDGGRRRGAARRDAGVDLGLRRRRARGEALLLLGRQPATRRRPRRTWSMSRKAEGTARSDAVTMRPEAHVAPNAGVAGATGARAARRSSGCAERCRCGCGGARRPGGRRAGWTSAEPAHRRVTGERCARGVVRSGASASARSGGGARRRARAWRRPSSAGERRFGFVPQWRRRRPRDAGSVGGERWARV